jgi:aspartyl-tRNA(Asn)/glutamyl-tRNA(Gln) amidotransferase subunit C
MSDFNIHYVARLARVALSPEEESRLGGQLDNILGYIAKLREVNVDGVEPMSHAFPLANVARPDEPGTSLPHEEAMRNAPSRSGGLFVVPKIVE